MNRDVENLKIVRILDAMYCLRCEFAYVADVLLTDGKRKQLFYRARQACDNWTTEAAGSGPAEVMPGVKGDQEPIVDGWEDD